jgi:hypothetical protein
MTITSGTTTWFSLFATNSGYGLRTKWTFELRLNERVLLPHLDSNQEPFG